MRFKSQVISDERRWVDPGWLEENETRRQAGKLQFSSK